ncbi:MAG: Hpt domain-containing protein [Firmicutes bacterium]|nr:Hpt domain-containing protein [Bacillota bacterium]
MNSMLLAYLEETEDMFQKAEECLIRLEKGYSTEDVNELFRIAHTIKSSSYMVGYEDIGNLMHKVEDMLDCVRTGKIKFDPNLVSLCFEGFDTVKMMLQCKKNLDGESDRANLANAVLKVSKMIDSSLKLSTKKEEKILAKQKEGGIVTSLLNKKRFGKNMFYIYFIIEKDAPMVSPVFMMILKSVESVGSLVYTSISDEYLSGSYLCEDIRICDVILSTDLDEAELYAYFNLSYVEKINVVNISRRKMDENDIPLTQTNQTIFEIFFDGYIKLYHLLFKQPMEFGSREGETARLQQWYTYINNFIGKMEPNKAIMSFAEEINALYNLIIYFIAEHVKESEMLESFIRDQYTKLLEKAYKYVRGKFIYGLFRPRNKEFISRFKEYIGLVNKSFIRKIFLDMREISVVEVHELKELIDEKRQLERQGIEINIIANGPYARRIINIFDSIKSIEEFKMFSTELDAVIGRGI